MDYQKLFLQRWKELENEIELEKEDGETSFLEKDIFFKFFTSPELLVGYYVWRESGNLEYAYELFMDEYDDWVDDCKDIAFKAKAVFEEHIKQCSCKRMVRQLKKCYGICWNCGRPFTQSRTDQLFCSAKCRNKYRYTPVPRCKNCTAPDCAIRDEQRAYAPKACPERNH